jgi:two-component system chemotaxis response regulator CheY
MSENIRFLVVDDDDQVRKSVIESLISFGYDDVREAATGVEALEILKRERIDFVISDWEMPGITGIDLLRTLKSDPRLVNIPFIMITSPTSKERFKIEEAALGEVDAYIIKPFRARTLKEKIETLIPEVIAEKAVKGKTAVLLVDDDDGVRETMREYLGQMGYHPIIEATDGEEGFQVLKQRYSEIALVLSDWDMPRLAGIDLLKRIREDAEVGRVPFIMVTSQQSIERIKLKKAIESDVDHYLLKPVRLHDLKDKIRFVLDKAKTDYAYRADLELGDKALAKLNYREAEQAYTRASKLSPKSAAAYVGLARVHMMRSPEKGQDMAIQHLKKAIEANVHYDQSYIALANIYEQGRSLDKAIITLQEGVAQCPLSEEIHYGLGRMLLMRAKKDEAMKHLEQALLLRPDYTEAKELLLDVKARRTRNNP